MERYIQVLGSGVVYAKPDTFVIYLTITNRNIKYDEVIKDINKMSDELVAIISSLVSNEKIEISSYYVDTNYQQQKSNSGVQIVPVGYIAKEVIKVEIPTDLRLLQDVMNAAIYSKTNPEIRINPSLSNKKDYIDKAIVNAIDNAYEKASLISNKISVKIQGIQNVEYKNPENIELLGSQYSQLSSITGIARDISLEPVVIEERVLITYAI